ncbi:hypothetical protein JHK86_023504 [Glycine max]|nr:hypothetical protein JHK86_023504 [Glycine max]
MPNASLLPEELIAEILSWVPVKALMQFRCVSKTWNSLILHPTFVKLHLHRSSKNSHILVMYKDINAEDDKLVACVAPCSIRHLLENPSSTEYWFRFWNPATRVMSIDSPPLRLHSSNYKTKWYHVKCALGYDDLSETYKVAVVLSDIKSQKMEQCDGQFVNGTVNWLALRKLSSDYIWRYELVIFSYDMKNETYRYLLKPDGMSEVSFPEPRLGILKGYLCLSCDHGRTHFVVWLMREFGVEKSWTQLLNVSYEHLQLDQFPFPSTSMIPLCMSEDEDVMLLASYGRKEFVLVNKRDNRMDDIGGFDGKYYWPYSYDYVPSLVLPYRN